MDWFDTILTPIRWVVAWILVLFHQGFDAIGMDPTSGWTWALSIVGLVLVIRIVLIPLFVRQIKASRGLALMQPEMAALQAKYKGKTDQFSRQAMAQEQMELFKKHGTSPFSSCLPILAQMPIFFSLYRVLASLPMIANGTQAPIGGLTQELAAQAESSSFLGARFSETFLTTPEITTKIIVVFMILLMSASQFITQKQIMAKNLSEAAANNPFMRQQKIMLYLFPIVFAVGGISFPIGVLVYWLVSNLWTMGQQFYVIRQMPAPGSPAEKARNERLARKRAAKGIVDAAPEADQADEAEDDKQSGQRAQPVRKNRKKRR